MQIVLFLAKKEKDLEKMPFGSIARLSAKRKFTIGKRREIMLCSANRHTRSSNAIELEEDTERAKFQSMSMHPDPVYHDSSEYSLQKFDNVRERSEVRTLILNPKVKSLFRKKNSRFVTTKKGMKFLELVARNHH